MEKEIVYWTTRDGNKISVDDMDIDHLRNTLKFLIRGSKNTLPNKFRNYQLEYDEWLWKNDSNNFTPDINS